jgi:hypothetical protein
MVVGSLVVTITFGTSVIIGVGRAAFIFRIHLTKEKNYDA